MEGLTGISQFASSSFASTTGFDFASTTAFTDQIVRLFTIVPIEVMRFDAPQIAAGLIIAAVVGFAFVIIGFLFR